MKTGTQLILRERERQIHEEGWGSEHDDEHTDGSLALAAICYAAPVLVYERAADSYHFFDPWPSSWDYHWDKRGDLDDEWEDPPDPKTYTDEKRIDLLIKAGALIAAEIDRLNRASRLDGDADG